jgi:hypothetical protein
MSEPELQSILNCIDAALEVYRKHEGKLSALEISLKSMLMVVRAQAAEQLSREKASSSRE